MGITRQQGVAAEQFEVACYTALVAVATELRYPAVARLCQQNLDEDEDMATWLLQQIPVVASHDVTFASSPRR